MSTQQQMQDAMSALRDLVEAVESDVSATLIANALENAKGVLSGHVEGTGKPEKGTPWYDVAMAAIDVAVFPPLKPQTYSTQVAATLIGKLRETLDAAGVDWKAIKR